jgi:hypothetical protein
MVDLSGLGSPRASKIRLTPAFRFPAKMAPPLYGAAPAGNVLLRRRGALLPGRDEQGGDITFDCSLADPSLGSFSRAPSRGSRYPGNLLDLTRAARFSIGSPPTVKTKPDSGRSRRLSDKTASRAKTSPSPSSAPVQTWTGRLQIQATPELIDFLNRQGALPDRGRSSFSLSNVMRRQVALLLAVINESDPRKIRPSFPQEYYNVTIEVLAHPWTLGADLIRLLDGYIACQTHLPSLLEREGVERSAYLHAIHELSFAERVHIVEMALIRHAPPPPELSSPRRRR